MNASDRAAQKFLAHLQRTNTALYQHIMSQPMGAVNGDESTNGFWSNLGTKLGDFASSALDYGIAKEQARQQAKVAEQQARELLAEENARLDLLMQQQQTQVKAIELQREQFSITQAFQDLDVAKYKKVGLYVAGGLGLWLVWRLAMANN